MKEFEKEGETSKCKETRKEIEKKNKRNSEE